MLEVSSGSKYNPPDQRDSLINSALLDPRKQRFEEPWLNATAA
jgi:hypothetical protein